MTKAAEGPRLEAGEAAPRRLLTEHSDDRPAVSVVVTVVERPADLVQLYWEYSAPLRESGWGFEFLFVLDPGSKSLRPPIEELARSGEPIRILDANRGLGEAGQLNLAGSTCRANIVLTLPAYYRVEAGCLPELVRRVEASAHMASARRWPRRDAWLNRLQNRAFNFLAGAATKQPLRDVACGVRAMRREVLLETPLYGDSSRFLPLMAMNEGFNVEEVACTQHPADQRARLYPMGTYIRRLLDLFGMFFILRFTYKPLRFFGMFGGGLSAVGGGILVVLFWQRLMGQALANRPLLVLGVLLFTLGIQVIALGLVGELIVHLQAPARPTYRIQERV